MAVEVKADGQFQAGVPQLLPVETKPLTEKVPRETLPELMVECVFCKRTSRSNRIPGLAAERQSVRTDG
jgi:hypothetical protein